MDFVASEQTFVVVPDLPYFGVVEAGQQFTTSHEATTYSDEAAAKAAAVAAGWVEPSEDDLTV